MEEEEDNHLSHFDLKQKEILSVQTTKLLLQKTEALSLNISGLHESLRHGPLLEPLRADVLSQGRLKESNDSTGSKAGDEGRGATGKRWTSFTKAAVSPKREEEVRRTDRRTKISTFGEESKLLSNSTTSFSRLHGYARYKKNLKNRVEALLNKITERHVTRTVEAFFASETDAKDLSYEALCQVDLKETLLLEYSQANIEIPAFENLYTYFGKLIVSKCQVRLLKAIFWFTYKCNFLPSIRALDKKTRDKRERGLRRIKAKERAAVKKFISPIYVDWLKSLTKIKIPSKRDLLHKYLQFATAHAVIAGYRYLCPGSRHLYTSKFRTEVFEESSRLLMSYEFSPESIKITCSKLFPEDIDIIRDCSIAAATEELKPAPEPASNASERYNAKGVGTLLETYLENHTTQLTRSYTSSPLHLLRRTKYSPAFSPSQDIQDTDYNVEQVAEEHSRRLRDFQVFRKECRDQLAKDFKEVSDEENAVYNGDTANAGRVCLDLVQKHLTQKPALKHKGNGNLNWHGLLEVNKGIPIAERVVAVQDALNAVKAKEDRNPRTRARLLLLKHGQS